VFVFSGMGPQWWAMGRELLEHEPVFRAAVERVDAALRPLAGWSVIDRLLADEPASLIQETNVAQPALFAIQVGLAALWKHWASSLTPSWVTAWEKRRRSTPRRSSRWTRQ
jgi:acyl transferase domain-containing protein